MELPTSKGALESTITKAEKRSLKIQEIAGNILASVGHGTMDAREISSSNPTTSPVAEPVIAPVNNTNPSPTVKFPQIAEVIANQARAYQAEHESIAAKRQEGVLIARAKEAVSRRTKQATSVKVPESVLKEIMLLNGRLFDFDVRISMGGLIVFAMDTLRQFPESGIAEIMSQYNDRRMTNQ
jgi:hypothetical protein